MTYVQETMTDALKIRMAKAYKPVAGLGRRVVVNTPNAVLSERSSLLHFVTSRLILQNVLYNCVVFVCVAPTVFS